MGSKGWVGLASKNRRARHRREGRGAVTFAWPAGGHGRHRSRQPSTGLIAVSAVVLAASAASSTVQVAPEPVGPPAPAAKPVPADGGSVPVMDFPQPESHLASGRFLGMPLPATGGASIPATVLAAYQRAVERMNMVQPNCHIPLELLAAIGKVESGHARGGRVDAEGRTLAPILGPVLNGGPFAAIADTDGGEYDGDKTWDRAVGPMQFIPSTWSRWASDGNADGRLDPSNVYDASLAAARYLCAANRDLGTPEGLDEAVLSYNHSTSYLSLVRSWMAVYRNGTVSVDDILDAGPLPVDDDASATSAPSTSAPSPSAPSTPATPPPGPATPSVTVPTPPTTTTPTDPVPPPSTTPSTTDPTSPPPTPPPTTDPASPPTTAPTTTDPTSPPPTGTAAAGQLAEQPPANATAEQCGPLDTVGGLIGEDPNCVHELELSTPDGPASTVAAETTVTSETTEITAASAVSAVSAVSVTPAPETAVATP
jgi:membrane-bound lytic murein transglycosylase B